MQLLKLEKDSLLMTGGHAATTALAVVEEIKQTHNNWKLFWIGTNVAIEGVKSKTLESEVLPAVGVKCFSITTGRLQRRFTIYSIPSILKIPIGILQSFAILIRVKPAVVLSFGGFASFPATLSAKILGIPVVIHEQTAAAGRASIIEAIFATKIAISRESSLDYFPKDKCVLTGNPVRSEFFKIPRKSKLGNPPHLYITGGSRGSRSVNAVIMESLPKLIQNYKVIHQCGDLDFADFKKIKDALPKEVSINYEVYSRIPPLGVIKIFENSDIIISRSGANTVSEIIAAKRPAILIPLAISYLDEQSRNAYFAQKLGIAEKIFQVDLTSDRLLKEIEKVIKKYTIWIKKINSSTSPDLNASANIVSLISKFLQ